MKFCVNLNIELAEEVKLDSWCLRGHNSRCFSSLYAVKLLHFRAFKSSSSAHIT